MESGRTRSREAPRERSAALCAWLALAIAAPAAGQSQPGVALDARTGAGAPATTSLLARTPLTDASESGPRVNVLLMRTRVVQEATVREITEAGARVDSLVFRGLPVEVGASVWLEGMRLRQVGGHLATAVGLTRTDTLRVRFSHDPIWQPTEGVDPLRGLRVRDMRQLDWGLSSTDLRASFGSEKETRASFHLEGGGTFYNDGNRRGYVSGRMSLPLVRDERVRVALEPNVYAEHFRRSTTGYLTPGGYASAGAELSARSVLGTLAVNASVNPHGYRYPGFGGVGVAADFEISISTSRFGFGVWGELLHQGPYHFTQVGIGARVN